MQLNYITPKEVAKRILKRKPIWYHGNPSVEVIGVEGNVGKVLINFYDYEYKFGVYLKDKKMIEDICVFTIINFDYLVQEIITERMEQRGY